jgi:hypothetical protein
MGVRGSVQGHHGNNEVSLKKNRHCETFFVKKFVPGQRCRVSPVPKIMRASEATFFFTCTEKGTLIL